MPQINSPTSSQVLMTGHMARHSGKGPKSTSVQSDKRTHTNEQESESDDAVIPKTPTTRKQKDLILSDRSTDEETIKSDEDMSRSGERDSPQYTSASSDDDKNNNNKNEPSKRGRSVA